MVKIRLKSIRGEEIETGKGGFYECSPGKWGKSVSFSSFICYLWECQWHTLFRDSMEAWLLSIPFLLVQLPQALNQRCKVAYLCLCPSVNLLISTHFSNLLPAASTAFHGNRFQNFTAHSVKYLFLFILKVKMCWCLQMAESQSCLSILIKLCLSDPSGVAETRTARGIFIIVARTCCHTTLPCSQCLS